MLHFQILPLDEERLRRQYPMPLLCEHRPREDTALDRSRLRQLLDAVAKNQKNSLLCCIVPDLRQCHVQEIGGIGTVIRLE